MAPEIGSKSFGSFEKRALGDLNTLCIWLRDKKSQRSEVKFVRMWPLRANVTLISMAANKQSIATHRTTITCSMSHLQQQQFIYPINLLTCR